VNPSLSIVLPVRNAEERLATQIGDLLDILPDLTARFEVLVVDNGSSDETAHVAADLARCYPQVRLVRHPVSLGIEESIQTGIDHTEGEIVLVGDQQHGMPADDLLKLWHMRLDDASASLRRPAAATIADRLKAWTPTSRGGSRNVSTLHVIQREADESLRIDRISTRRAETRQPSRPNFLSKIKAFALGE
jgi:glycosyltransferase involved in cell wall biosynthesis